MTEDWCGSRSVDRERAVGMLMERYRITPAAAHERLRVVALREESDVDEVVERLLTTRMLTRTDGVRGGGTVGDVSLSERERQVVALIAVGASNDEIAAQLFLGLNTVKTYIRTAYRKIGVTRRAQAVIWAREHGLVGLDVHTDVVDDPV